MNLDSKLPKLPKCLEKETFGKNVEEILPLVRYKNSLSVNFLSIFFGIGLVRKITTSKLVYIEPISGILFYSRRIIFTMLKTEFLEFFPLNFFGMEQKFSKCNFNKVNQLKAPFVP